jgi:drug/metabolite transporter (DMT)-like permease
MPGPVTSPSRPTPTARPRLPTVVAFVGLALAWGSSFVFIKTALTDGMAPLTLVTWRLVIATAFLLVLLRLSGDSLPRDRDALRRAATLALLNVAIPFAFIAWGVQWIPSAVGAMFNGTVPLFSIVLAALILPDEPITVGRLSGLALGFGGALLLAAPHLGSGGTGDATMTLLGELAVMIGAIGYASGYVYARRNITGRPMISEPGGGMRVATPLENSAAQSVLALPMVAVAAVLLERPDGGVLALPPTTAAWISVAWLGVVGSGIAYLFFFRVVRDWGAMRASLVTYLVPVVGIVLGVAFLGEMLEPIELAGAALIISGVVIANSRRGTRRLWGRTAATAG